LFYKEPSLSKLACVTQAKMLEGGGSLFKVSCERMAEELQRLHIKVAHLEGEAQSSA
jgi:hypothetical protein